MFHRRTSEFVSTVAKAIGILTSPNSLVMMAGDKKKGLR